jgi:parallel beta-helix repeat protein
VFTERGLVVRLGKVINRVVRIALVCLVLGAMLGVLASAANAEELGEFTATAYYCVYESEMDGNQLVARVISDTSYTLKASFLFGGYGVGMQGTGRTGPDGDYIHYEGGGGSFVSVDDPVGDAEIRARYAELGVTDFTGFGNIALEYPSLASYSVVSAITGASGQTLIPWYSIAVDPSVISLGAIGTLTFDSGTTPDGATQMSFRADDTGGAITGNHIDIYVGEGESALDKWYVTGGNRTVSVSISTTIYVPDDYPTIQAAVDAASSGDTIIVRDGTYTENIDVNKDHLTIQSENGAELTIVQAASIGEDVFEVMADYVSISGFTINGMDPNAGVYGGILLNGVDYCDIFNNICSNNYSGIFLRYANKNNVLSNNCLNNGEGIFVEGSSRNNNVSNNVCSNNEGSGITLWYSENNKLKGNIMVCNGIFIVGASLSHYLHEIDESNTVNGKSVYYWKDVEGGRIPNDAGEVILVNCKNVLVENQNLDNSSIGIEAAFSSFITIKNNTFSDTSSGIDLEYSDNNSILNNVLNKSRIILWYSNDNTISNNACPPVRLRYSDNNVIYLNNLMYAFVDPDSTNTWNSPEEITYTYDGNTHTNYLGNYWSDYGVYLPATGHSDPDDQWEDETLAYDENRDTYARVYLSGGMDSPWLEFLASSGETQGIRFWGSGGPLEVDIYYEGNWHCLKDWPWGISSAPANEWVELTYPSKIIEMARIKFHGRTLNGWSHLNEFQFKTAPADADNDGIADAPYCINGENDNYPLVEPFENYQIVEDTTPPTVSGVTPENGATNVAINPVVTTAFSEAMDSSTITTESFTLSGSKVSGTVTYDSDTYTATFTPDANLDYDHEYTATLSTAITDEAGNPLPEPYTWSFITQPRSVSGYPEIIKVLRTATGEVEEVNFKDYVKNVLPNEWAACWDWDIEALKAGAMAVRTYGWYWITHEKYPASDPYYDVRDDEQDQVYDPHWQEKFILATSEERYSEAIDDTWKWVMTRNNQVFESQYDSGTPGSPDPLYPGRMSQWGTQYWAEGGEDWQWILHYYYDPIELQSASYSIEPATGTGTAAFATDNGAITDLSAVDEGMLPEAGKPDVEFPHGLFSFNIVGITPGSSATVTIVLPSAVPAATQYWKCQDGAWVNVTLLLSDNDGDNILLLTLTDGGLGDSDGSANGTIVDPGGPVIPAAPTPSPPGGGGGVAAIIPIVSGLVGVPSLVLDLQGIIQTGCKLKTDDDKLTLDIPEGTKLLNAEGEPLTILSAAPEPSPPPPPSAIILAYNLGQSGATFSPAITLTFNYNPANFPEDVVEEDLYIAYWDGSAWVAQTTTVNTVERTVSCQTSHFTIFALVGPITPPAPAAFSVSSLSIQPAEVQPNEVVTVTLSVANTGGSEGSYNVVLKINGAAEAERSITLAAGESQDVSFSVTKAEVASYSVDANGLSGSFTVVAPAAEEETPEAGLPISWALIWIIIAVAVVVGLIIFLAARQRA